MTKSLRLADDLTLPLDAVTEKLAFLGRTGTGKTYAAMKLAELMLEAGAQIVALDFVGKWYGLRVPGAGEPFQIPVFGGLHGDYPLESTGGKLVADLIIDRNLSAVLDVSQFTRGEQIRFALDFGTAFFQRKKAAPSAVHLFLEECQEVLPQNPQPNEGAMLGAFERIWKLGRNFGIGGSLISQRPQEVNKKALNMSATLFVFQMTGPQERKTIESWVTAQDINEDIADVLPTLTKGRPHVWSVAFEKPISKTVAIETKRTADVSATLLVNPGARKERPLTPIDAAELATAMAETIERSKQADPKELRKQLAESKRTIAVLEARTLPAGPAGKTVEILTDADRALVTKLGTMLEQMAARLGIESETITGDTLARVEKAIASTITRLHDETETLRLNGRQEFEALLERAGFKRILEKLDRVPVAITLTHPTERPGQSRPLPAAQPGRAPVARRPVGEGSGDTSVGNSGLRRMLIALAQRPQGLRRIQLGVRAGLSPKTGTFATYLGKMRSSGWAGGNGDIITITPDGVAALGAYTPLPEGRELADFWINELGGGAARMLHAAVAAYPRALTRDELGAAADLSPSTSTFATYLGKLRSLELVSGRSDILASEELFS